MEKATRHIALVALAVLLLGTVSCRRTKTCACNGVLYGKPETLYFDVEHSFHCEDIKRSGYERLQDTIHIRTMHNVTCVDYEDARQ